LARKYWGGGGMRAKVIVFLFLENENAIIRPAITTLLYFIIERKLFIRPI
jgi:hypothetical protein